MQTADGDEASLVALDPASADKSRLYTFPLVPRSALSAYSRSERVYYYLLQGARDIQRLRLAAGPSAAPQVSYSLSLGAMSLACWTIVSALSVLMYARIRPERFWGIGLGLRVQVRV